MPSYIPEQNDIIFIDFEPVKGKEIGKYRPALVLSSQAYNQKTGLLICCPISTSIRGHVTEVPITNMDTPCVVASSLVQTLAWKERKAKKVTTAQSHILNDVLIRLLPLIGADQLFEE